MKINLYDPKTGELHRVHHHNVDGWIDNGFLTSPPDLTPIAEETEITPPPDLTPIAEETEINPKKKAKSTLPVDPE